LPKIDQGEFTIKVDLPVGSRVEFTNEITKKIEDQLKHIPEIASISSVVGSSRGDTGKELSNGWGPPREIIVTLKEKRKRSTNEVVQDVREYLKFPLTKKASGRPELTRWFTIPLWNRRGRE